VQLEAIASRPIAGYLGEETNSCLATTMNMCEYMYVASSTLKEQKAFVI